MLGHYVRYFSGPGMYLVGNGDLGFGCVVFPAPFSTGKCNTHGRSFRPELELVGNFGSGF